MGRGKIDLDVETLYDLAASGHTQKSMAGEMGISVPTLAARITEIQSKQAILLQYRALQSLQLTGLQARILENITDDKIEAADLKDLVVAFKILKDKELVVDGKPSEIRGLVAHLIHMEKEMIAGEESVGIEFTEGEVEEVEEDRLPNL